MSVLFQALSKAAKDYRSQSLPPRQVVNDGAATIMPLWPQPIKSWRLPFHINATFVIAAAVLVSGLAVVFLWPRESTPKASPVMSVAQEQVKPIVTSSSAPTGIVLNADKFAPEENDDPALAEVAQQLGDLPVISNDTPEKSSGLTVQDEDIAAPDENLDAAQEAIDNGDYDAALRAYGRTLASDGDNVAALSGKAYVLQQLATPAALDALRDMAAEHKNFAPVQASLARLLTQRGENQMALSAWRRAIALDRKNDNYRLSLAILYDRMGDGVKALALYHQLPQPLTDAVQQRVDFLAAAQSPDLP